jgi:TRAP-type C4-dicarboxylate transport system permease large subunit
MEKLVRPLLPFLAAIVTTLLLVAFFPELALVVPRVLGLVR